MSSSTHRGADTARYGASDRALPMRDADQAAPQNLAPKYEQLADAYAHAKDKVIIAKVDADGEGRPLGQKYGVTGFPSMYTVNVLASQRLISIHLPALKWFGPEGGEPEKYEGGRELLDLAGL